MSVFNIEPHNLIKSKTEKINNYEYDFLNNNIFDCQPYYYIINTYDNYKLKNIYHNIYIKLFKINKKYPEIKLIKKNYYKITNEEFNKFLKEYINGDLISMIIIANAIQIYYT